ncbi:hypothetical protein P3T43_001202 [Paraburkholderia sp. GAS41]|jgi:hypothetical protein|uniref:hypothetical protein n=1 Tax=Paraburkholderia sp. GAS41 TaxID=3035134 RepID=UPI003D1C0745
MLSPHEIATLMLVKGATERLEVDRADLDVLLSHRLVSLEHVSSGQSLPRLTREGHWFLRAAERNH